MIQIGLRIIKEVLEAIGIPKKDFKNLMRIITYKKVKHESLLHLVTEDIENDLNGLPIVLSTVDHSFKIHEHEAKQVFDYLFIDDANFMLE